MIALLLTFAMLHPVHETVAEIEWNEKTERLEVALRLDPLDEQWLRMQAEDPKNVSQWATDYLRRKFRVTEFKTSDRSHETPAKQDASEPRDDPTDQYHWIGRDDKGSYIWWYFEIEPADHGRPQWIDVRLLWERNENYVNRILVLGHKPRRAHSLTIQRPRVPFDDPLDEQPHASKPDR